MNRAIVFLQLEQLIYCFPWQQEEYSVLQIDPIDFDKAENSWLV